MGGTICRMAEIDNDEVQWLVVDKGSSVIKAGFSGHDSPLSVFHSVVCGRQLTPSPAVMAVNNRHYAGDEARSSAGMFELEYPIKNGIVQNWDYMERIYKQIFVNDLRVESKDRPILLSDPCFNPKQDREKHTQMLFESFQSPAVALHNEGCWGGMHLVETVELHCAVEMEYYKLFQLLMDIPIIHLYVDIILEVETSPSIWPDC